MRVEFGLKRLEPLGLDAGFVHEAGVVTAPDTININGLIPNPIYPASSYSPSGYFIYDNALFFPTQPYLDNPGVLFSTVGLPGVEWNLFSIAPTLLSVG